MGRDKEQTRKGERVPNLLTKRPLFRIGCSRSVSHSHLHGSPRNSRPPETLSHLPAPTHSRIQKTSLGAGNPLVHTPFGQLPIFVPWLAGFLGPCISFASAAFRSLHRVAFPSGFHQSAYDSRAFFRLGSRVILSKPLPDQPSLFLLSSFAVRPFLSVLLLQCCPAYRSGTALLPWPLELGTQQQWLALLGVPVSTCSG